MRIYILLLFILLISILSCSSAVSKDKGSINELDITKDEALRIAPKYLEEAGVFPSGDKMLASKYNTPRNIYLDNIKNRSIADDYYKILQGKRYWAVCFYSEDLKDHIESCPVVLFIDARNGKYLTLLLIMH